MAFRSRDLLMIALLVVGTCLYFFTNHQVWGMVLGLGGLASLVSDRINREDTAEVAVPENAVSHAAFTSTRLSLVWLAVRLWVGGQWLEAGEHKLFDPAWTQGGTALKAYIERAVAIPE